MAAEEARTESRGTHFRADYPETSEEWNHTIREKLNADKKVEIL